MSQGLKRSAIWSGPRHIRAGLQSPIETCKDSDFSPLLRNMCNQSVRRHTTSNTPPPVCVCVCVICTFRGRSLCSVGRDAPFGSGLLRPLWNVGPPLSAESEPLWLAG